MLATFERSRPPDLVVGHFETIVDGKIVRHDYAYIAKRATIFDEQLIAWANARDEHLKKIRAR